MQIRYYQTTDYAAMYERMVVFSQTRSISPAQDEIWCLEHHPIYTQGLKNRNEERKKIGDIPIICSNRGGDITYHGPGQLVVYLLLDLHNKPYGIHGLVSRIENTLCEYLKTHHGALAYADKNARGVYVDGKKIASIGLRAAKSRYCYHGFSLNIHMDLKPFDAIEPCGLSGMQMTQIANLSSDHVDRKRIEKQLLPMLINNLQLSEDYEESYHG